MPEDTATSAEILFPIRLIFGLNTAEGSGLLLIYEYEDNKTHHLTVQFSEPDDVAKIRFIDPAEGQSRIVVIESKEAPELRHFGRKDPEPKLKRVAKEILIRRDWQDLNYRPDGPNLKLC